MGIPAKTPPIASRVLGEYTIGRKFQLPVQTEAVKDAAQSSAAAGPLYTTIVWAARVFSPDISVGILAPGAASCERSQSGSPWFY